MHINLHKTHTALKVEQSRESDVGAKYDMRTEQKSRMSDNIPKTNYIRKTVTAYLVYFLFIKEWDEL